MTKVRSFDVFDTCLLRNCAFASDVFLELARALAQTNPSFQDTTFAEDFLAARIKAEDDVRARAATEHVTLQQIWQELAPKLPLEDCAVGIRLEIEAERQLFRTNQRTLSLVQAARNSGTRIVFMADTCLPAFFIRQELESRGFFREGDGLYLSSEIGLIKKTGNLFRHMLRTEGCDPANVCHHGGDARSDLRIPQSLGMRAKLLPEGMLDRCERGLLNTGLGQRGVISRLAGGCRTFRLSGDGSDSECRNLVAEFLGPFLLTFASWALAAARNDGVGRLYFVSRDCYLAGRVARILAPNFGIETKYLQVSRQALLLPSIQEISPAGMSWLRRSFETPSVERLLAKLDLTEPIAGKIVCHALGAQDEQHVITGEGEWETFWRVLQTSPVRELLNARISERRKHALDYFEQQELNDSAPWALVDLGWHLTCQSALKNLLQRASLQGYFLGLHPERNFRADAGRAQALFYNDPYDRRSATRPSAIFSRINLLEHIIGLAPHGSVHHYQASPSGAIAVCAEADADQRNSLSQLERLIEQFAAENAHLAEELASTAVAQGALERLTHLFFSDPRQEWIQPLRSIKIAMDQNNLDAVPVATPATWHDFLRRCLPGRLRRYFPAGAAPWPEASHCVAAEPIKAAMRIQTAAFELARQLRAFRLSPPLY